ncbi:MAG TPA: hypothetical protein VN063_05640 [Methylophilaceae bacterium]|nr:hypothetical protein [Methylophilaceae bacterium]
MAENALINASIQQLNLGYDGVEDRLLLRLGLSDNTEVKIWLTRRMVKAVWGLLQSADLLPVTAPGMFAARADEAPAQSPTEPTTQSPVKRLDFTETYDDSRSDLTEAPLLPRECRILALDNGQHVMELQTDGQMNLRIPMNQELIQALTNMLQITSKDAGWDLSFAEGVTLIPESTNRPVLH